ncbi:MAG: MATE family efflux transporter [Lachnospiraceae bacterium]|nr:MATE family efflux transporter [Lachnospiraceae bacterium]
MKKYFVRDRAFYKLLFALLLPVVAQNMITIGVNIMDNVMLGKYGEVQLSGCSLANDFINIFHILCMGMGSGAAVLTAQYYGEKRPDKSRQTVAIMFRICFVLVILFSAASLIFSKQILHIYTTDEEVIEQGALYLRLSVPTFLLMGISQTLTMVLRSVRKAHYPLYASIVGFVCNVFFNWVFIFGHLGAPELKIAGAAIGTVLARVFETAMVAGYFFFKDKEINFRFKDFFLPAGYLLKHYIHYSIPVLFSDLLLALGNTMVSIVIGHVSTEFVAANAIIATIVRLSTVFAQGLGNGAATIVGNELGAGKIEEVRLEARTMAILAVGFGVVAGGVILILSPWIISLYEITETTRGIAKQMMVAVSIMVVFQALQSVLTKGILRGGGDTQFCLFADAGFLWLVSVPLGYLTGVVWGLSPFIIYISLKIDWMLKDILCLFRLKSGKWMKKVPTA